jgi:hypothetical protein
MAKRRVCTNFELDICILNKKDTMIEIGKKEGKLYYLNCVIIK